MSPVRKPVLELRSVSKRFGAVQALIDVDFGVCPGEVVALVGDNGAGKSTLVKVLAGIHGPDEGEIRWQGSPVRIDSPKRAAELGIATVYQDLALADNLDVVANLFIGREAVGHLLLDEVTMEQRTGDLLGTLSVSIPDLREEVGALSGGQRQSVAIARTLLGEPRVVLLDEPTAALGVPQTKQVLELIGSLRDRGLGVVVISHNLADVFQIADRIFVLRLGRPAADLRKDKTNEQAVVAAITGAVPAGTGVLEGARQ